jgi:hypothetical protein
LENHEIVDQTAGDVLRFIDQHTQLFRRQGTVVEIWRRHGGRRLGPYYRLAYREGDKQCSWYLGASEETADTVRRHLQELQEPRRQQQQVRRCRQVLRRQLARVKAVWAGELEQIGLRLHGNEVRGWSVVPRVSTGE